MTICTWGRGGLHTRNTVSFRVEFNVNINVRKIAFSDTVRKTLN
jgi:hypothetical protein